MPTVYIYLGITIYFFADEHEPIHVHGRYQGTERKAEIIVEEGKVVDVIFKDVKYKRRMEPQKAADFEKFVRKQAKEIVTKWVDFFVLNKKIEPQIITRKVR